MDDRHRWGTGTTRQPPSHGPLVPAQLLVSARIAVDIDAVAAREIARGRSWRIETTTMTSTAPEAEARGITEADESAETSKAATDEHASHTKRAVLQVGLLH